MGMQKIIRFSTPKHTFRVWIGVPDDYQHVTEGISQIELLAHRYQDLPMHEIVKKLLESDGVEKVECIGWNLCGIVMRKDE